MRAGKRPEPPDRRLREVADVDRLPAHVEAAGADAAELEDVGDQSFQPLRLVVDGVEQLGAILDLIKDGAISGKIAKDLFEIVWTEGGDPRELVEARGMKQVTDLGAIEKVVDDIIAANPDKVAQAKAKPQLAGWFVGQVMKSSGGKVNPQAVNDLLKSKLGI